MPVELFEIFLLDVLIFSFTLLIWHYLRMKAKVKAVERKNKEITNNMDRLLVQEKLTFLGQIADSIAHEIKNPLNFVNNFALNSFELTKDLAEELEKQQVCSLKTNSGTILEIVEDLKKNSIAINRNGQRVDRIIQSIMQHAITIEEEPQLVNIHALIDNSVKQSIHNAWITDPFFDLTITKEYDAALGLVEVIPRSLARVLSNITTNAIHALCQKRNCTEAGFTPILTIHTRDLNDKFEISIQDNGPGIPEDIHHKIFTPFFTTKTIDACNIGLGLFISYNLIVNAHNGTLTMESEPDLFTKFVIRLPNRNYSKSGRAFVRNQWQVTSTGTLAGKINDFMIR